MTTRRTREQRKAIFRAPWHRRRRMVSVHLSEEYLEDRKRKLPRAIPVRQGDVVKVVRGDDAGKEGKVAEVDYRRFRVTIEGITHAKADGTQVAKPIHPSNLRIEKLEESDPTRLRRFEGGKS